MTKITSNKAELAADIDTVFGFLNDMNNYELLLPKDKISDWKAAGDHFSCKIQNTYKISLNRSGTTENTAIHLVSDNSSPLKFSLDIRLIASSDSSTTAQLFCDADLNPFLKMMAMSPLQNLFNYMANRLEKVHGKA
jgi:carbon monoxide dehydrogenase subunit G